MVTKNDIRPNDQVVFTYNGGSRPGATRIVDVEWVGDTSFRGYDHYTDEDRSFCYNKITFFGYKYRVPRSNLVKINCVSSQEMYIDAVFVDTTVMNLSIINGNITINNTIINSVKDLKYVN